MKTLGVVMAGGQNTRYGGLKAFAQVGDQAIVQRVLSVLHGVCDEIVVIANDAAAYAPLGLPVRGDMIKDKGPIAGLLTALKWSEELGMEGILAIACDMPFASGDLAREIVSVARKTNADVVTPESGGRRGIEPLLAFYSTRCIRAVEAAVARDDQRMIGFHAHVQVARIPLEDVQRFGDPAILFMNVNTPDELVEAQRIEAAQR